MRIKKIAERRGEEELFHHGRSRGARRANQIRRCLRDAKTDQFFCTQDFVATDGASCEELMLRVIEILAELETHLASRKRKRE